MQYMYIIMCIHICCFYNKFADKYAQSLEYCPSWIPNVECHKVLTVFPGTNADNTLPGQLYTCASVNE